MTELKSLVDHAAKFAVDIFEKERHVSAMWIADTASGERMVVGGRIGDKDTLLAGMRQLFKERGVVRYCFMTEAWLLVLPENGKLPQTPPSEHPERREVLMIQGEDDRGNALVSTYFILRPEHGAPRLKRAKIDMDQVSGRFTGLLSP